MSMNFFVNLFSHRVAAGGLPGLLAEWGSTMWNRSKPQSIAALLISQMFQSFRSQSDPSGPTTYYLLLTVLPLTPAVC